MNNYSENFKNTKFVNPEFQKFRDEEFNKFQKLGMPNNKLEEYRFTNLESKLPEAIQLAENNSYTLPDFFKDKKKIVFVDGKLNSELSDYQNIKTLSDTKHATEILGHFESILDKDALMKLNLAFLENGTYTTIEGQEEEVLYIIHFGNSESMNFTHHLINATPNSEATICEVFLGENSSISNSASSILVDKNAKLEHIVFQNENIDATNIKTLRSIVKRDGFYNSTVVHLGSKLSRLNFHSVIDGENANTRSNGLYAINGDQHIDNNTLIEHSAPHSFSDQLYKGILDDNARGVFTGRVLINKDSQLVESSQLNKNLLLSKKSHANSMPQLEIFADDVKCSHGSTTGQLNPEELFYFQARGINEKKAKTLLANAFAFDIVYKIDNKEVSQYIANELLAKFETFTSIKDKS